MIKLVLPSFNVIYCKYIWLFWIEWAFIGQADVLEVKFIKVNVLDDPSINDDWLFKSMN